MCAAARRVRGGARAGLRLRRRHLLERLPPPCGRRHGEDIWGVRAGGREDVRRSPRSRARRWSSERALPRGDVLRASPAFSAARRTAGVSTRCARGVLGAARGLPSAFRPRSVDGVRGARSPVQSDVRRDPLGRASPARHRLPVSWSRAPLRLVVFALRQKSTETRDPLSPVAATRQIEPGDLRARSNRKQELTPCREDPP